MNRSPTMSLLREMLADPSHVWSVGTPAAALVFVPSAPPRDEGGALLAESGASRLWLLREPRLLAYETISSDPLGWNQGLALCVEEPFSPPGPDLGGDEVARLRFRPDPDFDGPDGDAARPGTWIVETAIARIETRVAGPPSPVLRLGSAGPPRTTPLPAGWRPAAHVFPPHPARVRPGEPSAFDPDRHAVFQSLLARHGRPQLWRLKRRVLELLARDRFEEIATDRHGAQVIRVTLRQWRHLAGRPPERAWLARHDPPLLRALEAGQAD